MQEKMSQEAMDEEVMMEMTQEDVWEEGAGVAGNVESDELETKTQENPHHHPMRIQDRKEELQETSRRCATGCGKWSGDMPQEWKTERLVLTRNELPVMTKKALVVMVMKKLFGQIKK